MGVIDEDMRAIVDSARLGFVATVCEDGSPNLSPKGTVRVYDDEHLVFLHQASPQTVANLRRDPRLEINVVDFLKRRGYRFKGTAVLRGAGDPVFEWIHDWLVATQGPGYPALEAILVTVERALPVDSPAYTFGGATERDLQRSWAATYGVEVPAPAGAVAGVPETMHAAYVEALGPAENIRYGPLPVSRIGPTDVLVAVEAVTVDPVDTFVRAGTYPTATPFPFVIGRDLVGTAVAVGDGVDGVAVGDRVWCNSLGHDGRQGSFAQYAAVAAERLYPLPDGVDPVHAVGVAHPAATAWLGLFRHAHLTPGQTVYVGGGAGNVGDAAVRLAVAAGARVIATASGAGLDRARAAGAQVVVDYRDPDAAAQVRAAAPEGLDVHWDTSGHHDLAAALASMRRGGCILVTAAGPRSRVELPVAAAYTHDVRLLGFVISNATVDDLAAAARALNQRLADGTLTARIADTLPLAAAADAHRRLEAGGVSGRLILRP